MNLWLHWYAAISLLRPAFTRTITFLWFVSAVAGLSVRADVLGVTSLVRALKLHARFYERLLDNFHSSGIKPDALSALWFRVVLKLFAHPLRVNGRLVLVGDGIKVGKRGKKMPAIKLLHQVSDSNKAEFIMGHSLQSIGILVQADKSTLCVPLVSRIHEGLVWSNRDKRTLLDKMLNLQTSLLIDEPYYFLGDAYYAAGKIADGLLEQGHHLVSRVKSNAVAYEVHTCTEPRRRGRPKTYGAKIALTTLFSDEATFQEAPSPVYGETDVTIRFRCADLMWRPSGRLVRFVATIHPVRGRCLLMTTDTSLSPLEIIHLYGLRFKIEHTFKQAVNIVGAFAYHFWMKAMKPTRRRSGDKYLHHETQTYRDQVKRKVQAYHVFIQAAHIAQGLAQYLSSAMPAIVWASFGSWLRTIRPGVAPSEMVVFTSLRNSLPEFLLTSEKTNCLAKFIFDRQDHNEAELFRLAG